MEVNVITAEVFCRKCGKSMTDTNGSSYIGVTISIPYNEDGGFTREFVNKQLGKYNIGESYHFCYECLIDTYGGNNGR